MKTMIKTDKTKIEILTEAAKVEGRRRKRTLNEYDVDELFTAIADNPDAEAFHVYADGGDFVSNSYKYRAPITRVTANKQDDGSYKLTVGTTDAKRSRGEGAHVTACRNGQWRSV